MLLPKIQVLVVTLNSALLMVVLPNTSGAVPELVSVMVCAAAVDPTVVEAKLINELASEATGEPVTTATPAPANNTVLEVGDAL